MILKLFKIKLRALVLTVVTLGLIAPQIATAEFKINIMGPLWLGDKLFSPLCGEFGQELRRIKRLGVDAVSIDIWWGAVEVDDGQYDWRYYDQVVECLKQAELKWIPILSFHQLGGNVGDEGYQPLPNYIFKKYVGQPGVTDETSLLYKSEQGQISREVISPWATDLVLEDYKRFMRVFQQRYAAYKEMIEEVNISLGPAGELRTPSYNSHDKDTGYPTRGGFQGYSDLAIESFRHYVFSKHGFALERINEAWGSDYKTLEEIRPPENMSAFFEHQGHFTPYGKDLFDWYNHSLTEHGKTLLLAAAEIFNHSKAPLKGVPIGAKIPGIHWRIAHDRLAELNAGLIRTSYTDWNSEDSGFGYLHTVKMFRDVARSEFKPNIVLHFTALEMDDGMNGSEVGSMAKSLVHWMKQLAHRLGVEIKGENALASLLKAERSWDNIREALDLGYSGVTLLRLEDILESEDAVLGLKRLVFHRKLQWCRDLLHFPSKATSSANSPK